MSLDVYLEGDKTEPKRRETMSPIEIAARAGWNEKADEFHQWETLSAEEQVAEIDGMRAALRVLAECDLSEEMEEMINLGWEEMIDLGWEDNQGTPDFNRDFAALLHAIAKGVDRKIMADKTTTEQIAYEAMQKMAAEAEIYKELWRPEEIGISKAEQLIQPLTGGLARLRADPDKYKLFNPENGWGNYELLVRFVEEYLEFCKQNPTANVQVSR